jgi:transposase
VHTNSFKRIGCASQVPAKQPKTITRNAILDIKGAKTFIVLPKRWIVERTLAWLGRCRTG